MCGIAGFVLRSGQADAARIRAMCDIMRHRGPDDFGFHLDRECALGMRRLSIIDLNTGHQPISNEDGSVWVVFNGEIYNYQSLRRDLQRAGHAFRTDSDTETLIHLYEEEGRSGLDRLRGMFAYAIWDGARNRLFIARDRFGKKPLYYAESSSGFWFGSELKCLRAAGLRLEPDAEGLRLFFQFGYIPDPYTAFAGVRRLPSGSWLTFENGQLATGAYWRPPEPSVAAPTGLTPEQARSRLRDLFDESVRLRMIADVPIGAFLSGGIDSACVVASMARQTTEPVRTFSIGFEEAEFNELEYARLVAARYKTQHREVVVRPDSVDLMLKLVRHFDEPFGDSSAIPTYIVSEIAAQHVKVALSGDGGDELFAGYPRFSTMRSLAAWNRMPAAMRAVMAGFSAALPYSAFGRNYLHMLSRDSALTRYVEANFAPWHLRARLLRPEWRAPSSDAGLRAQLGPFLLPGSADPVAQAMYFESAVNLPSDLLVKVDRMSMANSLEVRCPLLDHVLAEFAAALPHEWKIRNGRGKAILVEALGDRLPTELLSRPKMGFAVPLAQWFRTSLREMVWDHLTGPRFLARGIVDPAAVRLLLEEHQRGRRNHYHWLFSLLMLELWFEELDGHDNSEAECCASLQPAVSAERKGH